MKDIIEKILEIEWRMFDKIQNEGGRAACQEDHQTFTVMRKSQLLVWSESLARSWLDDLTVAEAAGRNLMTEKYAYMMLYTDPKAYAKIEKMLPVVSSEKKALAEEIVAMNTKWNEAVEARFPRILAKGRPLRSVKDHLGRASVETYLRCELWTYSKATLSLMRDELKQMQAKGTNYVEAILRNTVSFYGYPSLETAEEMASTE
jgi:hypothetical protein